MDHRENPFHSPNPFSVSSLTQTSPSLLRYNQNTISVFKILNKQTYNQAQIQQRIIWNMQKDAFQNPQIELLPPETSLSDQLHQQSTDTKKVQFGSIVTKKSTIRENPFLKKSSTISTAYSQQLSYDFTNFGLAQSFQQPIIFPSKNSAKIEEQFNYANEFQKIKKQMRKKRQRTRNESKEEIKVKTNNFSLLELYKTQPIFTFAGIAEEIPVHPVKSDHSIAFEIPAEIRYDEPMIETANFKQKQNSLPKSITVRGKEYEQIDLG